MDTTDSITRNSRTAPFGTWKSPITASQIATKGVSIEDLQVDKVTHALYQVEKRPSEGGRNAIVATRSGEDVFGMTWNARSRVHEYGGSPAIVHNSVLYFSHIVDGRVYKVDVNNGEDPVPVTPENSKHRFANFAAHPERTDWLVSILEDHTNDAPTAVKNTLVLLDTVKQSVTTVAEGADFYARPEFSPDGKKLAWQQWHNPDMPWDGSELIVADCAVSPTGLLISNQRHIAGERRLVSAAEPAWSSNTTLCFTCDKHGFLNPWRCVFAPSAAVDSYTVEPISKTPIQEDFGEPAWMVGWTSYAFLDTTRGVFSTLRHGRAQLYLVDLDQRTFQELPTPYVVIQFMRQTGEGKITFLGKKVDDEGGIVELTFESHGQPRYAPIQAKASESLDGLTFSTSLISLPRPIELKVPPNDDPLHVVYYPPTNPDYTGGLPNERPPAVVYVHGGPVWMTDQALDWTKQFFTSRGWAWIDLNHRGSSGYGREYINWLKGGWGIVEVQDAVECIHQLDTMGLIDDKRATIRGRSAGGFTTLAALTSQPTAFAAGTPSFGVSDLRKLQEAAHKFEGRFLEGLLGGSMDVIPEVWKERSPITKASEIRSPLLILQGAIDTVVPPAQAEDIVATIRKNGGRVEYVVFEGEGHGWRRAETVQAALEKELAFYEDVLGLGYKGE